jgi:hypothetical protein
MVLVDVLVVDPDRRQREERPEADEEQTPQPVLRGTEQPRHHDSVGDCERVDPNQVDRVDDRAAGHAKAQPVASDLRATAEHRVPLGRQRFRATERYLRHVAAPRHA